MKKTKRLIAVILALVFALSALAIPASAKTLTTSKHYDTLTVIGDSVGAGYGLCDDDSNPFTLENFINMHAGDRVEGSYPDLVAKAVGAKTLYNESREGYSAGTFLRMLDPEYEEYCAQPENYLERFYTECGFIMNKLWHYDDLQNQKVTLADHVKAADCVIIQLGSNDIGQYGAGAYMFKALYYAYGMEFQPALTALKGEFNAITTLDQLVSMVGGVSTLEEEVNQAEQMFFRNYDKLVKKIRELNPNADIYVVGMYNSFKDDEPQDNALRQYLSNIDEGVLADVKTYMTKTSKYRNVVNYVDAPDVEYYSYNEFGSLEYLINFLIFLHPTHQGHEYIANQIIYKMNGGNTATRINRQNYRRLVRSNGVWGVYKSNGDLYTSYTGVAVRNGKYYYVRHGVWASEFSGIIHVATGSYNVKNGRITSI